MMLPIHRTTANLPVCIARMTYTASESGRPASLRPLVSRAPFVKRWRRPCTALEPNGWFCDSARQTRLLADELTGHLDGPSVPISASHA